MVLADKSKDFTKDYWKKTFLKLQLSARQTRQNSLNLPQLVLSLNEDPLPVSLMMKQFVSIRISPSTWGWFLQILNTQDFFLREKISTQVLFLMTHPCIFYTGSLLFHRLSSENTLNALWSFNKSMSALLRIIVSHNNIWQCCPNRKAERGSNKCSTILQDFWQILPLAKSVVATIASTTARNKKVDITKH